MPAVHAPAARPPDVVRREGNGLLGSTSEYLREHAHDPVDWQPWSDAVLLRAVAENKPIFLSIGYSACHFCHVMHDEVFAKDDVAAVLNERFISIKVDREERPDIDATYIAALERMTGSAGWPATLFLTPARDPFFGATYVPHDRFLDLTKKAADLYDQRDGGSLSLVDLSKVLAEDPPAKGTALSLDEIRAMAMDAAGEMDPIRGGMSGHTKFPMVPRLRFLLHATRKWDLPDLTARLRTTLDAMMHSALRDPISGGFHRYTTDAEWNTPHYEVMLYDDAQLASLYFEAGAALQEPAYTQAGRDTLDFLASEMVVATGAFAASFDADTAGEEGAAWRWSAPEVQKTVGADAAIVSALLGVSDSKIAPTWRKTFATVATAAHVTEKDVASAWTRARPLLRAARAGIAKRDDKIVAAWNGLAIEAFSAGFLVTGDPRYRDVALRAAEATWRDLYEAKGKLTRTPAGVDAFAIDDADLAAGYLALFEATSDARWLTRCETLLREVSALEAVDGGFYEGRSELARSISLDDGVEPSPTAATLRVLERRDVIGTADTWRAPVRRAATKYGNALRAHALGAAGWLDAALLDAGPKYEIVIAGNPSETATLSAAVASVFPSWGVVVTVPAEGANETLLGALPSLQNKTATKNSGGSVARGFVCDEGSCKAPTASAAQLRSQLLAGWKR